MVEMLCGKFMDEFLIRQAEERGLGKITRVLCEATILYQGWEMDNKVWIIEMSDGSKCAFGTSHGGICLWTLEDAKTKLRELFESAESIRKAIKIMWPDFEPE